MNEYLKLKERQEKETNAMPIFWAFSDKQFKEGMKSFGLDPEKDLDKIYSIPGGGYQKKTDAKALRDQFTRHEKEMADAIAADKTGEGFIFEMFDYELGNHEYVYTCDISDTLDALGLTIEDLAKNPALRAGLKAARTAQFGGEE
jgi:hypothetical protein